MGLGVWWKTTLIVKGKGGCSCQWDTVVIFLRLTPEVLFWQKLEKCLNLFLFFLFLFFLQNELQTIKRQQDGIIAS